ncbi:MAG TPA: glycosyltransferase family 9 protein [Stellaceae bacterium]|nr:glycosyltransferase family 9 protein [Stellaceae bacterium]
MDILFVTATRIGDAVLSTGLLAWLIERHPGARVTVAAGPVAAPLFAAVPGLERIIVMRKQPLSAHWLALWGAVAARRWDIVVDLRGSALAWMLRARRRRVMAKGDPRKHRIAQLGQLFDLDPPPMPVTWTAPSHDRAAEQLIPPGLPVLALGPGANWRAKLWRIERFVELARRLTVPEGPLPGARVAVLAAEHERELVEPLLAAIPARRIIDLVGRVDLLTAAAVLRRSALYIGNDSGLMHLAAAVGTPTLGLFGPSLIDQFHPVGPYCASVRTALPPEALFSPNFDHRTTDTLMDSLSVETVEAAARGLWSRVTSKAA